jgi:hypothetical protein
MSVQRLIIVCRGLFFQRTDVAAAQILLGQGLRPSLALAFAGKLF